MEIGHKYDNASALYSIELDYTTWTAVSAGTVTITDNYNNTFSVKGGKGKSGENNPSTGPTVSWGYTTAYEYSGAATNKALTIKTSSDATRTVYAKSITGATYGDDAVVTASKGIKQYVAPKAPGSPVLSYNKSRLTVNEPWTFSWTAATKTNSSSPVKGYRIYLYKNDSRITGLTAGEANNIVLTAGGSNAFLDRNSTSTTVILDPADFGFEAGDTVKLGICAYTRYGASNDGDPLFNNTEIMSSKYTIGNAGVVNVKIGGAWKEGQVYVKINNAWKEADTVSTKINGVWKDSQ
jgi:hypothetical protein